MSMNYFQMMENISKHLDLEGEPFSIQMNEDVSPNTHMFTFGHIHDLDKTGLIFVNKNGNFFRLVYVATSDVWRLHKNWNGMHESSPFQITDLKRANPVDVIKLASSIPQHQARLCLLPRDALPKHSRRMCVFGGHILPVKMSIDQNAFDLYMPDKTIRRFSGKLWESREAMDWCRGFDWTLANRADDFTSSCTPISNVVLHEFTAQEGHPLWGQF